MRTLIFCLALFLFACDKKDSSEPVLQSGFILDVKKNEKISTGEVKEMNVSGAVVHVWKTGNDDVRIKNSSDATLGSAYNYTQSKSISSDFRFVTSYRISQNVDPGKYLIFVLLDDTNSSGKFAYSWTAFEVKQGDITNLKKVFTSRAITAAFEDWNKTE